MRHASFMCVVVGAAAATVNGQVIMEDFVDGGGGAAFDPGLSYDFGTATDFTGVLDHHDLFPGALWLYADSVNVRAIGLAADEYIESVEVTWEDFCFPPCTTLTINGELGATASVTASQTSVIETWVLSTSDIGGERITSFDLSSFEGRIDSINVRIAPAPAGSLALAGLGGFIALRRRRN